MSTPDKEEKNRDEKGRFIPGISGNPVGRPKGPTLKEWARNKLMNMTEEEKERFIKEIPKEILWRMAEGNPHKSSDSEVNITLPIPILSNI